MITALLLAFCVGYVSSFWGQAARLFPPPVDWWHDIYYRQVSNWWHRSIGTSMQSADATALYRAVEAYLLGLLVPAIGVWIARRRPYDTGLRAPRPGTTAIGVALSLPALPIGILLSVLEDNPWGSAIYECLELVAMLPEHFLIFGIVMSLMLPGYRLSRPKDIRASSGSRQRKGDLAESLRLSNREVFAIGAAAVLFQVAHIGVSILEMVLALPIGLAFAYSTLFTRSIWPALVVHWVLNLLPFTWFKFSNLAA